MRKHVIVLVMLVVGASVPVWGQPVGSEFQVNTFTTGDQFRNAVASDGAGNFVVTWVAEGGQDGDERGVFAQRYDSMGVAQGSEFQVNTFTTGTQRYGSVSFDGAGNFVVAWESRFGQDGSADGVFAQRYDSMGVAQGSEFQVNTFTTGSQDTPAVSADAAGNFVVAWEGNGQDGDSIGVFAQRYDSTGVAQGSEFQVNTFTTSYQILSSVSSDAAGNFVVVWESRADQDGDETGVFAQRYDSSGVAQGSEFQVNTFTAGRQSAPFNGDAVSSDDAGNFVVVWDSDGGQDGSAFGVFAQRYDSSGVALGSEFQVNTFTTFSQFGASVSSDGAGNFAVVWSGYGDGASSYGIFARQYDSAGVAQGSEFQVNTFTTGSQNRSSVASYGPGNFVVVWDNYSPQDGSGKGVFAQRFAGPCPDDDLDGYADCTVAGCDTTGLMCGDCNDADMDIRPGVADPCDGVDNDCDTMVDEDFVSMPTATMCGVGPCEATGATMCVAGVVQDVCTPGPPTPEDCSNAIDDDCDGTTDYLDSDCPLTVFVTSTTSDGALGGIAGADQQCQALAAQGGLPVGVYKAWLSDAADGPLTTFTSNGGEYVLPDGTAIATDFADLTDGTLLAPIDMTEQALSLPAMGASRVWTGTNADGTSRGPAAVCSAWTFSSSFDNGAQGRWDRTDTAWSFSGTSPCNNVRRLYCFQQAAATVVEPPPGPRLIFMSSTQSNGNLGGLAGADATCNALATAESLPGSYKAWLSDDTESPSTRFTQDAMGYFRVDGTMVALSYADLSDGTLLAPITLTESSTEITGPSARVWTGADAFGNALGTRCDEWTTSSTTPRGANGQATSTASTWSFSGAAACNQQRRLYCVQQDDPSPAQMVRPREKPSKQKGVEGLREVRRR